MEDNGMDLLDKLFRDIDAAKVRLKVRELRDEHPDLTTHELCLKVIEEDAFFAGLIGGTTAAFPWPWTMILVAPDLIMLLGLQSRMVLKIAYLFGFDPAGRERAMEVLGCLGASVGAVAGTYGIKKMLEGHVTRRLVKMLIRKVVTSLARKSASRMAPFLTTLAGGALNYGSVQLVGKTALHFYESRCKEESPEPDSPSSDEKDLDRHSGLTEDEDERPGPPSVEDIEREVDEEIGAEEPAEEEESGGDNVDEIDED
ncbi:MAG: EcsC family protein [Candidatus Eremiobacteraeota bacterium]|nr:EcsC family protein [Candidatus Eremiobacteraeota bacterium]